MDESNLSFVKQGVTSRGLDLGAFLKFLSTLKGISPLTNGVENGTDLDSWTMAELKTRLDEFAGEKSLVVEETVAVSEASSKAESTNLYDLPELVQTKRSPVAMLSSDLVNIKVAKASFNVLGGIFKTNRNQFIIETSPYGWTVAREYKDLVQYRELVCRQFPGDIVTHA
eukprot:TRINITY_DN12186_c0_g4_i9.p1 TRINITY_DN12186_c0_g4~~TRINITY_DN12186_c0_g4_i9.p1  ORF type:complete len:170 (-),score=33.57 TRINITY_DN12186_c0_g4_i9:1343-1852(-)